MMWADCRISGGVVGLIRAEPRRYLYQPIHPSCISISSCSAFLQLAIKIFRQGRNHQPETTNVLRRACAVLPYWSLNTNARFLQRLERQAKEWRRARPHPNVLPFFGLYVGKPLLFPGLVSPLRQAGNILNFLHTSNTNTRLLVRYTIPSLYLLFCNPGPLVDWNRRWFGSLTCLRFYTRAPFTSVFILTIRSDKIYL